MNFDGNQDRYFSIVTQEDTKKVATRSRQFKNWCVQITYIQRFQRQLATELSDTLILIFNIFPATQGTL